MAAAWGGQSMALACWHMPSWLPDFLRQTAVVRPGTEPAVPIHMRQLPLAGRGLYIATSGCYLAIGGGAAACGMGLLVGRRQTMVPMVMAAVPIGGSYPAGATHPAFFKFLLAAVPFLCIVAALAWRVRDWAQAVPAVLTLGLVVGSALSLSNMFNDPAYARADYRGIAERIAADGHPNAAVILNAPNQWEVFTYYHREAAPVYPLPKGQPDPAIVEPELAAIASAHDRIYAFSGATGNATHAGWWNAGWTATHSKQLMNGLATCASSFTPSHKPQLVLWKRPSISPLAIRSFWKAIRSTPIDSRLAKSCSSPCSGKPPPPLTSATKCFSTCLIKTGCLVTQRDSEPGGGLDPTTAWPLEESIIDNHGLLLPANLQPGSYTLIMGLYDIANPSARLPLQIDGGNQDSWTIGTFTIK